MMTKFNVVRIRMVLPLVVFFFICAPAVAEAKWSLTPRVYVEGQYDDNIFLTETNEESDFITTISPGINLQYLTPTTEVNLDYEYQRFLYSDFSELDYSGHRGQALARKDFVSWFGAGIRETFIRSEDPIELTGLEVFERPSIRTQRDRYTRNIVEPDATFRFGENRSIRFGYRNNFLRNDREDTADLDENAGNALLTFRFNVHNGIDVFYEYINREYHTTDPPEPDRDHTGHDTEARYTYYIDPRTSVFVRYRYSHRDFEHESQASGFIDADVHDPRIGFSRDLYENVTISASAGYAVIDAEEDRDTEGSFTGRGDFIARYKGLTVDVYGEAGFDEDFLSAEALGYFEFWRAGINGSYELLEGLRVGAFFLYESDEFVYTLRTDKIWSARGTLSYQLFRWLSLALDYEHSQRDSSIPLESYRDNRYMGRLTVQYDIAEQFQ